MNEHYTFSKTKIEEYTEKVGVDIRPVIEFRLDREKLFDIGQKLVDKYPNLYESLTQSPTDFRISKKFIFPGKGEAEITTLAITQRGPVFIFPHKIAVLGEEIELNDVYDIAAECIKIFHNIFPKKKLLRVGLVTEYIFDTADLDSTKLIAERFTKVHVVPQEIMLSINCPTDDHNRKIQIEALRKLEPMSEIPGRMETKGYGVKVMVDFNNREMTRDLNPGDILRILHEGKQYNQEEIYEFLNGS
jgi:hypothetical protein